MVEPEESQVQEPVAKPKKSHKRAAIASSVLWVLSLVLSFSIPPSSPYIWVPDVVLLLGFIPLLFSWSPSWPWLLFGVLNIVIGAFLLLLYCLPDDPFPKGLHAGKHHICEYHPYAPWAIIGILATVYGIGRMVKNIVLWCSARNKAKQSNPK